MRLSIYTMVVRCYSALIALASTINSKASLRHSGSNHWKTLPQDLFTNNQPIWFHCASVGEFEQARPLIELLKAKHEDRLLVVTFFSPSGFEALKNYSLADVVTYLPNDIPSQVASFQNWLNPALAVFVKYEIWLNHLLCLKRSKISTTLISAHFPEKHWVFKSEWFGSQLSLFDKIFVQTDGDKNRLSELGVSQLVVSGDTRIDRVVQGSAEEFDESKIAEWCGQNQVLVIGSNWPQDDEVIMAALGNRLGIKVITAPHQLKKQQEQKWKSVFGDHMCLYSDVEELDHRHKVLYVNQIGLLSRLYRYGTLAYVGGGFGDAVHNVPEAAVYGLPTIFGPNNNRFLEIQVFKKMDAGFEIGDASEFETLLEELLLDSDKRHVIEEKLDRFFKANTGATDMIYKWVEAKLAAD